jgi:hypothetical protein
MVGTGHPACGLAAARREPHSMSFPRRIAPVVGLFFLAPLVAEFLLGNLPITVLPAVLLLAPMYGGGGLVIREVTRRAGRGVPTMLVLGVAYGLLEEGIATQSLFNPHYAGLDLLHPGYIPWLGIGVPWTLFVLTLHAVGSTTVPIVLVELCTSARRTTPWLQRPGLIIAAVLYVVGLAANTAFQLSIDPFVAAPAQLISAVVLAGLVVLVAFRLPRRSGLPGTVPAVWVVGLAVLVAGVLIEVAPLTGIGIAIVEVVLAVLGARWVIRGAWTPRHTLAAAAGALLTYAWHSFPEQPVLPASTTVDLAGNAIFTIGALLLIGMAWRRTAAASTIEVSSADR